MPHKEKNEIGKAGEEIALDFFKNKGYRIMEKNYKTVFGEIDIIAKDKDTIVFIEVKTRTDISFGYPFEAVNPKKRKKIKNVALSYMKRFKKELPSRFDVLSINFEEGRNKIEHFKDAFEV